MNESIEAIVTTKTGKLEGLKKDELFIFIGKSPEAIALSDKVQNAWLAFARTGNPACGSLGDWPQYSEKRETMILGPNCSVVNEPFTEELLAWNSIPPEALGML